MLAVSVASLATCSWISADAFVEPLTKHPEIDRQERDPLGDIIVQLARQPGALVFGRGRASE